MCEGLFHTWYAIMVLARTQLSGRHHVPLWEICFSHKNFQNAKNGEGFFHH